MSGPGDITNREIGLPDYEDTMIGVSVWENAVATRKLPKDMFRGEMDVWWEVSPDGRQLPTYIGTKRRELEVDKSALDNLGISYSDIQTKYEASREPDGA
jgi:hypothetical protein